MVKLHRDSALVAQFVSTLIWRARASGDESPIVLPAGTEPLRWMAPVTPTECFPEASSCPIRKVPPGPRNVAHFLRSFSA